MPTFLSLGTSSEGLKLKDLQIVNGVFFRHSLLFFSKKYMAFCFTQMFTHIHSFFLSFFSQSILIQTLFEIVPICFCFVQLGLSCTQSFVASFDEMCTCPHPVVLRISVFLFVLFVLFVLFCCQVEFCALLLDRVNSRETGHVCPYFV